MGKRKEKPKMKIPDWYDDEKRKNEHYAVQYLQLAFVCLEESQHPKFAKTVKKMLKNVQEGVGLDLFEV